MVFLLAVMAMPGQLAVDPTEMFTVGHGADERQFGLISSMAVSPEGHILVLDALNHAVTVFDRAGSEIHHWGRQGDGPGELQSPVSISVSTDMVVAVASGERIGLHQIDGTFIGTYALPSLALAVAFNGIGDPVALTVDMFQMQFALVRALDGEPIWFQTIPDGFMSPFFGPRPVFASMSSGAVMGASLDYRIPLVELDGGLEAGVLSRDVPVRRVPDSFADRLRSYMIDPASAPDGWSSMIGATTTGMPPEMVEAVPILSTFRVVIHAFRGPPGETLWVRRGLGVGDSLAPPFDPPDHAPLWDLFDGTSLEYIGTTGLPEGFVAYAGDDITLTGVQTDALGVQAVRAFSLSGITR